MNIIPQHRNITTSTDDTSDLDDSLLSSVETLLDENIIEPEPEEINPLAAIETKSLNLGWFDHYADTMSELTGSPREFNLLCGLVAAATAVKRKARLRMAFGDIYPNIYACIIAQSSVFHKSSSLAKVRALLNRAELDQLLLSELMTSEGLLKQLQGQPSGVVIRDEIGTLFSSGRIKYLRTLVPDLTALFDCNPYSRTLSQSEVKVKAPYLNIIGATTPARFYKDVSDTLWDDGFLARWLYVLPEGEPNFDLVIGMFTQEHDNLVGELSVMLRNIARQEQKDFALEADSFVIWSEWHRRSMKDAYRHGTDAITAIVTRYSTYALKFAILLSAVNDQWGIIPSDTMQTAIDLADNYKGYVHRIMAEKDQYILTGSTVQKVFRCIKGRAKEGKGPSTKEITQFTNERADIVNKCLEKLVEIGAVTKNKSGRGFRYTAIVQELPLKRWG